MGMALWLLVGLVTAATVDAILSRWSLAWVAPDPLLVVVIFVALHRPLIYVGVMALLGGMLAGSLAVAPPGIHELAFALCALWINRMSARLSRGGTLYFATLCLMAAAVKTMLVAGLLKIGGLQVGFSSWATAAILPGAFCTAVLGLLAYGPLSALEEARAKDRTGMVLGRGERMRL